MGRSLPQLCGDQLLAELIGEDACDLHVVALGVSAGDVFHGNVGIGRGALLPVARRVGTFHADAELVAFGRGWIGFFGGVVCVLRGRRRARAAGGEGKQHEGCEQGSDGSSEVHGVASFLNGNLAPWGGVGPSLSAPTSSETEKAVNARVEHLRQMICNTGKTETGLPTLR